jgi:hypothetical protein
MSFDKYLTGKKALIITLDDALYPKKDYLLQVYYLFAEFMAYAEQIDSKLIVDFMSKEFAENGEENIFEKAAVKFDIPSKYERNFTLLHENARLPLKLLLFQRVLELLQEVVTDRKQLFLLADGNAAEAINKIKQIEWNGLQEYLKVYFAAEFNFSLQQTIAHIMEEHAFEKQDVVIFMDDTQYRNEIAVSGINCFSVKEIS